MAAHKENRNYKLDHKLKIRQDDPLYYVLENDIDLISNHIYLFGIEGYSYGGGADAAQEPGVEYIMANRFIRNINMCMRRNVEIPLVIHMKTCFSPNTKIETNSGRKKISNVLVGDMVLTHKNRYRKVLNVISNNYDGDMIKLGYGRNGNSQIIKATPEHPILVERNGKKEWISFENVIIGDIIFITSNKCKKSGELIPYYRTEKKEKRIFKRGNSSLHQHLINDIIPFCEEKRNEGWIIVPVGGSIIPDAIGFKDGKIIAFEIENNLLHKDYPRLEFKKSKYDGSIINNYIDGVEWILKGDKPKKSQDSWFEIDDSGFIKVKIVSKERYKPNVSGRKVYNLTVEEDNSYVASRVVVHNCGGDWVEGMAIYDAIRSFPWPVTILNYSHARSMSSLIFQAGNKRVMMPNSYFMFNDGTTGLEGTIKQVRSAIKFDKKVADKTMMDIYTKAMKDGGSMANKPNIYIKKWLRYKMDKEEDVYLTAKETVELGLADEIFNADWSKLTTYTKEQLER